MLTVQENGPPAGKVKAMGPEQKMSRGFCNKHGRPVCACVCVVYACVCMSMSGLSEQLVVMKMAVTLQRRFTVRVRRCSKATAAQALLSCLASKSAV